MWRFSLVFSFLIVFYSFPLFVQAQGEITGEAISISTGKPLSGILIQLQGGNLSQITDARGRFRFQNLAPGFYQIQAIAKDHYITVVPKIRVVAGKQTHVRVEMVGGSPDSYVHMSLGGVTITEERRLVPEDYQTRYKIEAGEIEHLQATSLRDVLDLIPGVVRGSQDVPGLARASRVELRAADHPDPWSLFGTQVIVDGIPASNNANRQAGPGVGYGAKVLPSANTGVDLRTIPADNIASVAVLPGVPSVEYGDFTDGIIKVKTRSGELPPRCKLKNNPDTREFSLIGGRRLWGSLLNYTLNYAYSERDPRTKRDEVKRLVGELKWRNHFLKNEALILNNKLQFSRMFDEDSDPNDPLHTAAYNRDYTLSYGGSLYWNLRSNMAVESIHYFRFTRRKSYKKRLEKVDIRPITGSLIAGTFFPVDTLRGAYLSEVKTLGREYNIGWKLQAYVQKLHILGWTHNLLAGWEWAYDANAGEGKVFDPLRPPGGAFTIRPYSFDQEPGSKSLSLYCQDRAQGTLWRPLRISLGFRYDLYEPYRLFTNHAFIASRQGSFFNPRMGLAWKFFPNTQLRFSYGLMSKRPSLDIVYNQPYYRDLLDIGMVAGDSVQLVTTYMYARRNPSLKGFQQKKYELGIDQEFKGVGVSLTGYYQKSEDAPVRLDQPIVLHHYFYPDFKNDPRHRVAIDTLLINYDAVSPYSNLGWNTKYGVEFSLNTRRISTLNLRFRISAAYNYRTAGAHARILGTPTRIPYLNPESGQRESLWVFPFFERIHSWHDRIVINYFVDYFAKSLGIWLTLQAQNVLLDRNQRYSTGTNLHAVGFYSRYGTTYLSQSEAEELDLMRHPDPRVWQIIRIPGDKWLFSLNLSKSLFPGGEFSLYVINFLNDLAWYVSPYSGTYLARNPEIYYGIEFSFQLGTLHQGLR